MEMLAALEGILALEKVDGSRERMRRMIQAVPHLNSRIADLAVGKLESERLEHEVRGGVAGAEQSESRMTA